MLVPEKKADGTFQVDYTSFKFASSMSIIFNIDSNYHLFHYNGIFVFTYNIKC